MTKEQKALAILRAISERGEDLSKDKPIVTFYPDWGNHTLTVAFDEGHTHVGNCANTEPTEEGFEFLIDNLYRLFCKDGEGCLSLA